MSHKETTGDSKEDEMNARKTCFDKKHCTVMSMATKNSIKGLIICLLNLVRPL